MPSPAERHRKSFIRKRSNCHGLSIDWSNQSSFHRVLSRSRQLPESQSLMACTFCLPEEHTIREDNTGASCCILAPGLGLRIPVAVHRPGIGNRLATTTACTSLYQILLCLHFVSPEIPGTRNFLPITRHGCNQPKLHVNTTLPEPRRAQQSIPVTQKDTLKARLALPRKRGCDAALSVTLTQGGIAAVAQENEVSAQDRRDAVQMPPLHHVSRF